MNFLSGAANGRERFRQQGERIRADEQREVDRATAQVAYEAAQAERLAQYQRATGPQTTPEQRATQADERHNAIARLRSLEGQLATERRRLAAALEGAVAAGDLGEALEVQGRASALDPVVEVLRRQLVALGVVENGRPFSPVGVR